MATNKREYSRAYYAKNKDKWKAQTAAWRSRNPERVREYGRDWYHRNKKYHRAYRAVWYAANREAYNFAKKMGVGIAEARRILAELDARAAAKHARGLHGQRPDHASAQASDA